MKKVLEMKKILALLFAALVLMIGITACKNDSDRDLVKNNDTNLANNITTETAIGADKSHIILLNNKNSCDVKLEIKVPFYDEVDDITDYETDTMYMKANSEFAYQISDAHDEQIMKEIIVKAEEDKNNFQTTDFTISNETQGEQAINFKVNNNSAEKLEYMTAVTVFYKNGAIIGLNKTGETNVEPGSSSELSAALPTDYNNDRVDFDDYKIYVHGITFKK